MLFSSFRRRRVGACFLLLSIVVAFLLPPLANANTRTVYLAFNEPHPPITASCVLGFIPVSGELPSTFPAQESYSLSLAQQQIIENHLRNVFDRSGLDNVTLLKPGFPPPPGEPIDVFVYFSTNTALCFNGFVWPSIDRYNRRRGERAYILGAIESGPEASDDDIALTIADTTAHEIGHALGLRHMRPPQINSNQSDPNSTMDPSRNLDIGIQPRFFVNRVSPIGEYDKDGRFQPEGPYSNPQYHVGRFMADVPSPSLTRAGICPGDYDLLRGERGRFSAVSGDVLLRFGAATGGRVRNTGKNAKADTVIYDVSFYRYGGGDAAKLIKTIPELALSELGGIELQLLGDDLFLLAASSQPGIEPDLYLSPSLGAPSLLALDAGQTALDLLLANGDGPPFVVASFDATVLPVTSLADGFERSEAAASGAFLAAKAVPGGIEQRFSKSAEKILEPGDPCALVVHTSRASFQGDVSGTLFTENFDGFSAGARISSVFDGLVTFLGASTPRIFFGAWFLFDDNPAPISGGALLPEPFQQNPNFTFEFTRPVAGVGMDIYDDGPEPNQITLIATDILGNRTSFTESVGRSGNIGFYGFTSRTGIVRLEVRNVGGPSEPIGRGDGLEFDNLVVDPFQ